MAVSYRWLIGAFSRSVSANAVVKRVVAAFAACGAGIEEVEFGCITPPEEVFFACARFAGTENGSRCPAVPLTRLRVLACIH
jgi:hypothetical protein